MGGPARKSSVAVGADGSGGILPGLAFTRPRSLMTCVAAHVSPLIYFFLPFFFFHLRACLFSLFPSLSASNGCLAQASRIISQGYKHLLYVLPVSLREKTSRSHQTLRFCSSKRAFVFTPLYFLLIQSDHTPARGGIPPLLPSVWSAAPCSLSVCCCCCCVISHNPPLPPPSLHDASHQCVVP